MSWRAALLLAIIGIGGQAQSAETPALEPTSKWLVQFVGDRCLLSRDYGAGEHAVTLAYRPLPLSDSAELRLVSNTAKKGYVLGEGKIRLLPGGSEITAISMGRRPEDSVHRITTLNVRQSAMAAMAQSTELEFSASGERTVRVKLVRIAQAFEALKTCNDEVIDSWGVDRAAQARIVTPAVGTAAGFITTDDYPTEASEIAAGADSVFLWKIDLDGRVTECTAISGADPLFNKAGGAAILKRGRYKRAALDAAGTPIVSYQTGAIKWRVAEMSYGSMSSPSSQPPFMPEPSQFGPIRY